MIGAINLWIIFKNASKTNSFLFLISAIFLGENVKGKSVKIQILLINNLFYEIKTIIVYGMSSFLKKICTRVVIDVSKKT